MSTNEEWMALMTKVEDLHPDLRPYVSEGSLGRVLQHPLVYAVPLFSNAMANFQYAAKTRALAKARVSQDWSTVIWLHERPYRLQALRQDAWIADDKDYWRLVADVWIDSENIWQNMDEWIDLLASERPGREQMMNEENQAALAALGETLTVYRGCVREVNEDGLSWTLDKSQAEWFARRFLDPRDDGEYAVVIEAVVDASAVVALLTTRSEAEIVLADLDAPTVVRYWEIDTNKKEN